MTKLSYLVKTGIKTCFLSQLFQGNCYKKLKSLLQSIVSLSVKLLTQIIALRTILCYYSLLRMFSLMSARLLTLSRPGMSSILKRINSPDTQNAVPSQKLTSVVTYLRLFATFISGLLVSNLVVALLPEPDRPIIRMLYVLIVVIVQTIESVQEQQVQIIITSKHNYQTTPLNNYLQTHFIREDICQKSMTFQHLCLFAHLDSLQTEILMDIKIKGGNEKQQLSGNFQFRFKIRKVILTSYNSILPMNKENTQPLTSLKNMIACKAKASKPSLISQKRSSSKNEEYKFYMKYLIATNSDYFQHKLKGNQVGKPREIKFKMPSKTGMTMYKKDYKKQQNKYQSEDVKHSMSIDCIKTNNFLKEEKIDIKLSDNTMYQSDFKCHPQKSYPQKMIRRRVETCNDDDQNIPRFFQTQNKLDFLNWAGKNYVPSMKPEPKPAVTHAPLSGMSVYKSDFQGKSAVKTPKMIRQPSLMKFGCASSMMKTSYNDDYSNKKSQGCQIDCRPSHVYTTICKSLKGSTEYKRQYKRQSKEEEQDSNIPTLESLQTLIIDL